MKIRHKTQTVLLAAGLFFGCVVSRAELKVIAISPEETFGIETSKILYVKAVEGTSGKRSVIVFQNGQHTSLYVDVPPARVLQLLGLPPAEIVEAPAISPSTRPEIEKKTK